MDIKLTFLALGILIFVSGCRQSTVETGGIVEANAAYLKYFGKPPQVSKGFGYARVGFFPRRENPQKVSAVPLYLFTNIDQLPKILGRWTNGEKILPATSRMYNPLSAEDRLEFHPVENETLTLGLVTQRELDQTDLSAIALSLTETALQFSEIRKVRILLNGEPLSFMPAEGFQRSPQKIAVNEPPALIGISGVWEKDTAELEEILINFDRPVVINTIKLTNASGETLQGDYFRSVFDMAVVVHPLQARAYREKSIIHARWDVTDALGRSSSGDQNFPLEKLVH